MFGVHYFNEFLENFWLFSKHENFCWNYKGNVVYGVKKNRLNNILREAHVMCVIISVIHGYKIAELFEAIIPLPYEQIYMFET